MSINVEQKSYTKNIYEQDKIARVVVSDGCYNTSPCKHHVSLILHTGETIYLPKPLMSAKKIAEKYTRNLDIFKIMHMKDYVPSALEGFVSQKIKELTVNLKTVHVNRPKDKSNLVRNVVSGHVSSKPAMGWISGLALHYLDGSEKYLECRNPVDIVKYFGAYLDEESRNDDEIKPFVSTKV